MEKLLFFVIETVKPQLDTDVIEMTPRNEQNETIQNIRKVFNT